MEQWKWSEVRVHRKGEEGPGVVMNMRIAEADSYVATVFDQNIRESLLHGVTGHGKTPEKAIGALKAELARRGLKIVEG